MAKYIHAGIERKHCRAVRQYVNFSLERRAPYDSESPPIVAVDCCPIGTENGDLETPKNEGANNLGDMSHQLVRRYPLSVEL